VNFYDSYAKNRERDGIGSIINFPVPDDLPVKEKQSGTLAKLAEEFHRSPPQSLEIEQSVLGAIVSIDEAYHSISDLLQSYHMFEPVHQTIFESVSRSIREGRSVSPESLKAQLPADSSLGGSMTLGQYIDLLVNKASSASSLRDAARTVRELSIRRELIDLGNKIVQSAYDNQSQSEVRDQIERATTQLRDIGNAESGQALQTSFGLDRISSVLPGTLDSVARAYIESGLGLRTGFRDIDQKIVGLQPSELIVLASRPGLGKTALATNIAYNIARSWRRDGSADSGEEGGVVGLFSLEMSAEQIASRVISQQSRIPLGSIRSGKISEHDFEIIRDKSIEFQSLPFFIDETTSLSTDQLVSRARRLKVQRGLDLLIIDNLEIMRSVARTNFGQTKKQSFQITRQLRNLAKELMIPVLVLAQLPPKIDRRRGDLRPRLEDFDDEGAIEQDADVVLLLHREDFYLAKEEPSLGTYDWDIWARRMEATIGLAEIIVAKQRSGATGSVQLMFDAQAGSFADLASY
jgi:replicative DNA helicase